MPNEKSRSGDESYFDSSNCVDVYFDEPGDTTVRPCRPSLLAFMTALRARVMEAEAAKATERPENGQQPCSSAEN